MLKVFLWLRYLRRKRIVLLSIAAVAVSVALMVVVDSLFTGYIEALRQMTVTDIGDISFWPRGSSISDYDDFLDKLVGDPNIAAAAPFVIGSGLLHMEGGIVREVGIYGIDPAREKGFVQWDDKLLRQKKNNGQVDFSVPDYNDNSGAWLGINVIAEPNEETDEYDIDSALEFVGKRMVLTTVSSGGKRRVEQFWVSDIAYTQNFFGDKTLYLPFEQFNRIRFGERDLGKVRLIKVKVRQGVDPSSIVGTIEKHWRDFAVEQMKFAPDAVPNLAIHMSEDWHEDVFEDLRNQLTVVLLIFGVICSVAVLLIFCIFYMIVTVRQKDIAIIKSCGASGSAAASIFAGFGMCVGITGSVLGLVLAIFITRNINTLEEWVRLIFGIKLWRTSSYGLATIPHQVNWPGVPWIVGFAIAGCLIGVLIPAIIAARTNPVKILRYE